MVLEEPERTWLRENWYRDIRHCLESPVDFVDGGVFWAGSSGPTMLSLKALVLYFP